MHRPPSRKDEEEEAAARWLGGGHPFNPEALFSSRKFLVLATVALSFVCDNYYPIMK
jgi:hypothetical protein